MIFLVLSTIFILIYDIKHDLPYFLNLFEIIAIIIFIIEWLCRLWISSDIHMIVINSYEEAQERGKDYPLSKMLKEIALKKLSYIFSPMSIIDLLAILPSYRPLRFLRFLLLFRLFKIFRYTQNVNFLMRVFIEKKFEFFTLLLIFIFLVFFASTIIYIFEGVGANDKINSYYDAIYWAVVTITTVGYGDISPVTPEGRFVTIFLIIGGVGMIAFSTSIVTTAMTEKLEEIKENSVIHRIKRLKEYVLLCGYGRVGKILANELKNVGENVVILDIKDEEVKKAEEHGFLVLKSDASDIELLKELSVTNRAKYTLAMTGDDALNLSIILSLKALNSNSTIFSRANDKSSIKKLKIAGAKEIIFPFQAAAVAAVEYFEQPVAYDAIDSILLDRDQPIVDEIEIYKDSFANNKTLKDLNLKKYDLKLLGVVRGDKEKFYFNPKEDEFILKEFDKILLIGHYDDVASLKTDLFKG